MIRVEHWPFDHQRAIFVGLEAAVREMKELIRSAVTERPV
jgi:hypothetical protein